MYVPNSTLHLPDLCDLGNKIRAIKLNLNLNFLKMYFMLTIFVIL